jgi:hypothetical protein
MSGLSDYKQDVDKPEIELGHLESQRVMSLFINKFSNIEKNIGVR